MQAVRDTSQTQAPIRVSRPAGDTLLLQLTGEWRLRETIPSIVEVEQEIDAGPPVRRLTFDAQGLVSWGSGLLTFLRKVEGFCQQRQIVMDRAGLPDGIRRLLDLAAAVPERQGTRQGEAREPILARLGKGAVAAVEEAGDMLGFIGGASIAFLKLLRGRASFRPSDLALLLQECGAQALPTVTLISFLVGAILAFIGAVQLQQFGAQIYVANLVGLAMALEMGAMMTAIIMAGRTGAALWCRACWGWS